MATVTHAYVSALSDDPAATTAGKVTPSRWNAEHVIEDLVVSATLDFGSVPVWSKSFSFAVTGAETSQKVVMTPVGASDELEMDGFLCAARVSSAGTVTAYVHAVPGPVTGSRDFNLILG